jgi:hypothetical protein
MSGRQVNNATFPTFVKQLLLLVLPNNGLAHQQQRDPTLSQHSPFEEMYFSFPALEEDTSPVDAAYSQHPRGAAIVKTDGILC